VIDSVLRAGRTAILRGISPMERAWRRATGRPDLPPLWLRRHTGPLSEFETASAAMAEYLDEFGLVSHDSLVLDAGCGVGAMVPPILERLGPAGHYVGFDVHGPSIRWCRERWRSDGRADFHVAKISSAYGNRAGASLAEYRFPIGDGMAGLVLAKSLFTHLLEDEAAHYLRETRRALRPGKAAVVTAFLFDASGAGGDGARRAFPFADSSEGVRWRSRLRPEAAVAYAKTRFVRLVESAGLHVQWHWPGYYPGATRPTGQDTLLIGH